jgi:hypothetical protein
MTLWARRGETAQTQTPWLALCALMALAAALRAIGLRPVWVFYTLADYLAAGAPQPMQTLR